MDKVLIVAALLLLWKPILFVVLLSVIL